MLTLEEIKIMLRDRKLSVIAESTGISRQCLWNIMTGRSENPSYETVRKITEYLEGKCSSATINSN